MKHYFKTCISTLLFLALGLFANGQIQILSGGSTFEMGNSLAGNGITIVGNPIINCSPNAYGSFSNGQTTSLGISNGVLLTTGAATGAAGPNNSNGLSTNNGYSLNDPQLTGIEGTATHDVCSFELDVIPQCDTLTIRFVFGSEEYPEYVNQGFNDAFGFFVSGPMAGGGTYNNYNIARLPNNVPVSINNVNAGENNSYFINNLGGTALQYDGYTVVLSPKIRVVPCQTYHFKLIIGDGGDATFDSGVLIDFISCTNAFEASLDVTPTGCNLNNGSATVLIDGGIGPFDYNWSHNSSLNGNTATNLSDTPGNYSVTIQDLGIACSEPQTLDFQMVEDGLTPSLVLNSNATSFCIGDTIAVTATCDTIYTWVSPTPLNIQGNTAYFVVSNNLNITAAATNNCGVTTTNFTPTISSSPNIDITTPNHLCLNQPFTLSANTTGAGNFNWTTPNGGTLSGNNIDLGAAQFSMSGLYILTGSFDNCPPHVDSVLVNVVANPTNNLNNVSICPGINTPVNISPAGVNYTWNTLNGVSLTNPQGSQAILSPIINSLYIVSNSFGCNTTIQVNMLPVPVANVSISSVQGCAPLAIQFTDNNTEVMTFQWNFGDGQQSIFESPNHIFHGAAVGDTTYQVSLTMTNASGCSTTSSFPIQVMENIQAQFTASPLVQLFPNVQVSVNNQSTGSGTLSAEWIFENNHYNTWNNVTHDFSTWGDYPVTLVVSNAWCSDTAVVNISITPPPPTALFDAEANGCPGTNVAFESNSQYAQSVTWLFGDGASATGENANHTYTETGVYNVSLIAAGYDGSFDTLTLNNIITIYPLPHVEFVIMDNPISAVVDSASFNNLSSGAVSYVWNFGNGNSSSLFEPTPVFDLVGDYTISLTGTTNHGCSSTFTLSNGLTVTTDGFIEVPTAFTPLTDGPTDGTYDKYSFDNNIFHPHYRSLSTYNLEIFNKWGEVIFKSENPKIGWDGYYQGEMCHEDVYVWKVEGKLYGGVAYSKKGTVTLIIK
jgi:gliding motility-associated-like protein